MGKSFKDIYDLWTKTHNEEGAIKQRRINSEKKEVHIPTISELRKMNCQARLDLHTMTLDEAIIETRQFIDDCYNNGLLKIKIVTGKGLHSVNGEPVIRPEICKILSNHNAVREFDKKPKALEGGSGAVVIILKNK